MIKSFLLAVAVLALGLFCAGAALADDVYIGDADHPILFNSPTATYGAEHEDGGDYKGWAFVFVKNTSAVAWNAFNFKIFSYAGGSTDISQVSFLDATMNDSLGNPGFSPMSSKTGFTWDIDNDVVGAEMTLNFANNVINPNEMAWFQIYTDNTASQANFGLMMWPTAVPEPSSLLAISTSLLGLAGFALRRRS